MHTTLIEAVKNKKVLTFVYDGQNREVEPHAYGVSTKGNQILRVYQTAGGSNSGNAVGWHLFTVGKISRLNDSGDIFSSPRIDYKKGDSAMPTIYAEV